MSAEDDDSSNDIKIPKKVIRESFAGAGDDSNDESNSTSESETDSESE